MGKPLNEAQLRVIHCHFANCGANEHTRMRIDPMQSSVFNPQTGRLHVHRHDKRMSGKQELVFDSATGRATSFTSHTLKFWDLRRHATPREYARIQGFPETFKPPSQMVANLFGNAVAVPCAAHACACVGKGVDPPATFLDLCAGIGGFHLAATAAFPGVRCVGYCEIKPAASRTYADNFPAVLALGDITAVEQWPRADLVTAGFPCQPFSRACNLSLRTKHKDRLFYERLFDAIDRVSPRLVVLENVRALMCPTGRVHLEAILRGFHARGYQTSHRVLNAADFGLPQQRFRLYIIARVVVVRYCLSRRHQNTTTRHSVTLLSLTDRG